jgi:hypothetical protein
MAGVGHVVVESGYVPYVRAGDVDIGLQILSSALNDAVSSISLMISSIERNLRNFRILSR